MTRRVWLRGAIPGLSLTTGCISLEKSHHSTTHHLLWQQHRDLGEVVVTLTASFEESSIDMKQGHTLRAWKSHQDTALRLMSPKGVCITQWAVHPSAREDSQEGEQLPGSLCVLVPLHRGGSPQLSTPPPPAPFLSVLLSYRITSKLQTSE